MAVASSRLLKERLWGAPSACPAAGRISIPRLVLSWAAVSVFEIRPDKTHVDPTMQMTSLRMHPAALQAASLVLALMIAWPAMAGVRLDRGYSTYLQVAPIFTPKQQSLLYLLNTPPTRPRRAHAGAAGGSALSALGQALVLKPDLGACQSFKHGCREGDIVTLPHNDVMRTMGAGLGMRVGGVRFEYAYGLHTGANFIGIRKSIP